MLGRINIILENVLEKNKKQKLVEKIKEINTPEEFAEIDFKQYMRNDEWINSIIIADINTLEYLIDSKCRVRKKEKKEFIRCFLNAIQEKEVSLEVVTDKDDYLGNIKNWLRYRIVSQARMKLISKGYDCDEGYKVIIANDNYFEDWNKCLYADAIFSVYKLLHPMICKSIDEDLKFTIDQDLYYLKNLNEIYSEMSEKEQKVMRAIDGLAKYTHTFGNYMPCPNATYNFCKSRKYDSIYELQKEKVNYKKWIEKNSKKFFLEDFCEDENGYKLELPKYIKSERLELYIIESCEIIKKRSRSIYQAWMKGK